jgi:hypothetical protein
MWTWKLVLVASIAGLSGCAHAPYQAKVASLSAACSNDWSQLKPSRPDVDSPDTQSAEFAEHSACLGPPAMPARTSVILYDLSGVARPVQLKVKLPVSIGGTLAGSVDVLDAGFHLLEHHGFGEFIRRGEAYTLPVFLRDGESRYLSVSPDAAFVGSEVKTIGSQGQISPISSGYGTVMVVNGWEVTRTIPLMAGGKISVAIVSGSQLGQATAP